MPGRLSPAAVRRQIASGELEPLYLLTGNDEVGMSELASAIADSVEEDFRPFNVQRFYGSDSGTRLAAVLDAASTLPLLSPRRIVVLLQAERLLGRKGKASEVEERREVPDEGGEPGAAKGQLALLKEYANRPHAHATVVIAGAGLARTFEPLATQAAVVGCEASFDLIGSLSQENGVRFDRGAVELLRQRAGVGETLDGGRLRDDIEKVLLYAAGRQVITRELVAEVVGRPAAGGGRRLWNELADRNAAAVLKELDLELAEGAVPYMLLGLVRSVVERTVAAGDLPAAMDALMRTDIALKTSAGDPRVLLERLLVELCGTARERG